MIDQTDALDDLTSIGEGVQQLIDRAIAAGVVIRIDLVSQPPLAMGHLVMVPEVRPARQRM